MKTTHKLTGHIVFVLLLCLAVFVLWRFAITWYDYANPNFFWLLAIVPIYGFWYVLKDGVMNPEIKLSTIAGFEGIKRSWLDYARHSVFLLRILTLSLLTIVLARPQSKSSWKDVNTEGIDIVIALDISGSMLAQDFSPNRLEGSKSVAMDFIEKRPTDRIGLVVYEGESFTQCPLTTDHAVLNNLFKEVKTGLIEGGTAIGQGLATAVNRLRTSDAKSKVVILLTDGVNNSGDIPPLTAAEIANQYGIRVYTIGVGTEGKALSPVAVLPNGEYKYDYVDVKIDELTLKKIAHATDGKYYRATNNEKLEAIYAEIDQLEKTKINVTEHSRKTEEFSLFAIIALFSLSFEFLVKHLLLKTIP
jgi:Ca-activated chloride channel family protein